jgi:hypothetical protein
MHQLLITLTYHRCSLFQVAIYVASLMCQEVYGQVFPIQSNIFIAPPYTPQISAYTTLGSQKLTVQINANDITLVDYQVKLRITIEGVGITIRTKANAFFKPLLIQGGSPETYYGEDLAEYFLSQNLDFAGFSRHDFERTGKLPEGIYRFSIEVLDYNRNTVVSNKATTAVWMILNDPPLLNLPRNNSKIILIDPTNIPFTWTSRHSGSPNAAFTTEYIFRLVEIWPINRNPYDAFLTQQPLYEITTTQSQIVYTMAEPALIPGRRYAWQVQAVDTEDRDLFKNQGRSEVFVFQYGDPISQPENFRKEAGGETTISLRWEPPMNGEMPQKYRVRYKPLSGKNWYEEVTEARWLTLGQLRNNTAYELQIRSEGLSQVSDYTLSQRIKTDSLTTKNYTCGTDPQLQGITDSTPLFKLSPGDNFMCADFTVLVSEVEGTNGTFRGTGWQTINIFNGAKIKVSFSGTINSRYQLTTGKVVSMHDPNSQISNLVDEMKKIGEDKIAELEKEDKVSEADSEQNLIVTYAVDSIYISINGPVMIVDSEGNVTGYDREKGGDGRSKPIAIVDASGTTYLVGADNKIITPQTDRIAPSVSNDSKPNQIDTSNLDAFEKLVKETIDSVYSIVITSRDSVNDIRDARQKSLDTAVEKLNEIESTIENNESNSDIEFSLSEISLDLQKLDSLVEEQVERIGSFEKRLSKLNTFLVSIKQIATEAKPTCLMESPADTRKRLYVFITQKSKS